MKMTLWAAGLAVVTICGTLVVPQMAEAGPVNRACLSSDRKNASRELCGCLDLAARRSLSRSDQRKAARFFKDPQKAQEIRQSDRPSDEAFWTRYKQFTSRAAELCG